MQSKISIQLCSYGLIEKLKRFAASSQMINLNLSAFATNTLETLCNTNVVAKYWVKDFVDFMLNDVAKDTRYSSSLDAATINKLKQLQNYTDLNKINKKMDSNELSSIFGIDKNLIEQLFLFYRTTYITKDTTRLTTNKF